LWFGGSPLFFEPCAKLSKFSPCSPKVFFTPLEIYFGRFSRLCRSDGDLRLSIFFFLALFYQPIQSFFFVPPLAFPSCRGVQLKNKSKTGTCFSVLDVGSWSRNHSSTCNWPPLALSFKPSLHLFPLLYTVEAPPIEVASDHKVFFSHPQKVPPPRPILFFPGTRSPSATELSFSPGFAFCGKN